MGKIEMLSASLALLLGFNASAAGPLQNDLCDESLKSIETAGTRRVTPVKALPGATAIQNRANLAWTQGFRERAVFLATVHAELYYKFPGRESEIDRLMAAVKTVALTPSLVKKPIVVDLIGFPGDGKTSIVRELSRLLSLKNRAYQVDVKPGQVDIDLGIFRAISDVGPRSGEIPLSLLIIDEAQNFLTKDQLEAGVKNQEGKPPASVYAPTPADMAQARQDFIRLLYSIYGNGTEQTAPAIGLSSWETAFKASSNTLQTIVKERSTKLQSLSEQNKVLARMDASEEDKKIAQDLAEALKIELKEYDTRLENNQRAIKTSLRKFVKDYGDLFPQYKDLSSADLLNLFSNQSESFLNSVTLAADTPGMFQTEHSYLQMITVILGNPESSIRTVREQIRGQTLSADDFRNRVKAIAAEDVQAEMWDRIFGADSPGLRQRFNVDQWRIMLPLSDADWARFVDRQVEVMEDEFKASMLSANLNEIRLRIDPSVKKLLLAEARVGTEGARVYFERATSIIGNFFTDMASRIIELSPADQKITVQWEFDSARREFLAFARDSAGSLLLNERTSVRSLNRNEAGQQMSDYDKKRLLANLAGEIVMGMSMFSSLPMSFTLEPDRADWNVSTMWALPEKERHTKIAEMLRISLGASTAQNLLVDGFVPLSEPTLKFSHEMIRRMVDDLQKREEQYAYLISQDTDGKRSYGAEFPMPRGVSKPVLDALFEAVSARKTSSPDGKDTPAAESAEQAAMDKALRLLHGEVNTLMKQNSELLSAIARLMDERLATTGGKGALTQITTSDLQNLVADIEARYFFTPTRWQRWTRRNLPSTQFMVTLGTLNKDAGVIGTETHPLFSPTPVPGKRGFWARFKARYYKTDKIQRPLDPR